MLFGLGSAATLAVTMNPDFGQVEQDPAVLNLSVFETFYPEKRPFFLEDSRTFVPPYFLFQLFHSRRIGRAPDHFAVSSDDEVLNKPDETTILGAAKITGKNSGWTYGGLTAVTGREYATVLSTLSGRLQHLSEPLTSYNVVRVQRDIFGGSSNIGALTTGVIREGSDDAYTGGIDYNLRWDQNRTGLNWHWVATRAPGDGGVRTSGGGLTNFGFSRKHWGTWAHFDHFGPDFRVNDIGFFRVRANRNDVDGGIFVEQPDPGRIFRRYGADVCGGRGWNEEVVFDRWVCTNGFVGFLNFWEARQWIENSDTNADGIDDHIYGTLRRHVVDITLRGTYAIHRDLTLQAYVQPFVAVGDYEHIRRLARLRSFEFEPAALADDPDFNRKSLRGNVVLRWEYLRGSTLFLVWDLSTEDTSRAGRFSPFRDLGDAFGATARHVLMVKLTYWLNR